MKILYEDLMVKFILISPIAMLFQRNFDAVNKIVVGIIMILLVAVLLKKGIKKSSCILLWGAAIVFLYSLALINKQFFTINMLFYFPLWFLYLTYSKDYYTSFIQHLYKNKKFIKWIIRIWCLLVLVSFAFPSSYEDGGFQSFSNGNFRFAPTVLFMGLLIWCYSGITRNKNDLFFMVVPFVSMVATASRTYTIIFLLVVGLAFYSYFDKKRHFVLFFIPFLLIIIYVLTGSAFIKKFENAINNPYVSDPLAALTSNRSVFWAGELRLFRETNWINKLLGEGLTASYVKNMKISGQPIWAHNDFMEVLNAHGVIGEILYISSFYYFYKKVKKIKKLNLVQSAVIILVCVLNAFFNGLYVYTTAMLSIPLLSFAVTIDFSNIKPNKLSKIKQW